MMGIVVIGEAETAETASAIDQRKNESGPAAEAHFGNSPINSPLQQMTKAHREVVVIN